MALTKNILIFPRFSNLNSFENVSNSGRLQNSFFVLSVRTAKHWDPKWKWLRSQKIIPVELPNFQEKGKAAEEKFRSRLKELGFMPTRYWKARPMTLISTGEILSPYVPPKGDGKASLLKTKDGKTLVSFLSDKKDTRSAIQKIKSYEPNFDIKLFPQIAQDIYLKAHETLMSKDMEKLSEFVTERANQEMLEGLKYKTVKWKFIESLEPPTVVQVKCAPLISKENLFSQITVRFHTKQFLAIYDRFGRLFYGNEVLHKDVLEYAVFEKHIVNEYGNWRLHGKIIPEWVDLGFSAKTSRIEETVEEEDESEIVEEDQTYENVAETNIVEKEFEVKAQITK